jgi:hypothetical protein
VILLSIIYSKIFFVRRRDTLIIILIVHYLFSLILLFGREEFGSMVSVSSFSFSELLDVFVLAATKTMDKEMTMVILTMTVETAGGSGVDLATTTDTTITPHTDTGDLEISVVGGVGGTCIFTPITDATWSDVPPVVLTVLVSEVAVMEEKTEPSYS